MKKNRLLCGILIMITFLLCGCTEQAEKTVMDNIRNATVAQLEANGKTVFIDSEIDLLKSLADMELHPAPLEPADEDADGICRITFNPKEKVKKSEETVVVFYDTYIKIDAEYYLPNEGVEYNSILDWVNLKIHYFFEE